MESGQVLAIFAGKPQAVAMEDRGDVLTAIYYLRQHADEIKGPITTTIYSDGQEYPVIFRPAGPWANPISGAMASTRPAAIAKHL